MVGIFVLFGTGTRLIKSIKNNWKTLTHLQGHMKSYFQRHLLWNCSALLFEEPYLMGPNLFSHFLPTRVLFTRDHQWNRLLDHFLEVPTLIMISENYYFHKIPPNSYFIINAVHLVFNVLHALEAEQTCDHTSLYEP